LRSLLLRVLALTFAAFVVTIALQIAGLAPQARFNPRP
jgi:hypothetical protein